MENVRFSIEIKRQLNKIKTTKKLIKFNFKIDLFLQKGNDYIDIFVIIVVLTIDKVTLPAEQFLTLSKFIILKNNLAFLF